ncbi:MAG: 2-succinyl-5-enolpyruvyl-6-hydroxy-3-cyclohexene-1-carboxylic-acid synthase [Puniceicoccaceae bacterium]
MTADWTRYLGAGEVPTVNMVHGAVVMETLARAGVEEVVISPGSRSTPLTLAAARNPDLLSVPVLDERSAGFFALGLAKASGRPVGLICTSGSALAHYLPAVIEAHYSRTPMILLTADRPPELQECGSGQTIDQMGIFGKFVRTEIALGVPEGRRESLRYFRSTVLRGIRLALGSAPGPVHLNFPFRDPLAPLGCEGAGVYDEPIVLDDFVGDIERLERRRLETRFGALRKIREQYERGWILLGGPFFNDEVKGLRGVANLGRLLGFPILADVISSARGRAGEFGALITRYSQILEKGLPNELMPEAIIQIGTLPTSKRLRAWLESIRGEVDYYQVDDGGGDRDPLRMGSRVLEIDLEGLADVSLGGQRESEYGRRCLSLEEQLEDGSLEIDGGDPLVGRSIVEVIQGYLSEGMTLFFANSLAVRWGEDYFQPVSKNLILSANRGANGIDGNLSTAFGLVYRGGRGICLIGDLAFLHDSNGLLLAREVAGHLTILVIENGGGRIFERLPVAGASDAFERFFLTPQAVEMEHLCAAHGIGYTRVSNRGELERALAAEVPGRGCRVIGLVC